MAFPPVRGESLVDSNTPGVEGFSTVADGTRGDTGTAAKNGLVGTNNGPGTAPTDGPPAGNGVFGFSSVSNASGVVGIGPAAGVVGFSEQGDGTRGDTKSSAKNGLVGTNSSDQTAPPGGPPAGNGVFGFSKVPATDFDVSFPRPSGVLGIHDNSGIGVAGISKQAFGVVGQGPTGVLAQGQDWAVRAFGNAIGVEGSGVTGVRAIGGLSNGVGLFADHAGADAAEKTLNVPEMVKAGKYGIVAYGDSAGVNGFSLHGNAIQGFSFGVAIDARTLGNAEGAIGINAAAPLGGSALAGRFQGNVEIDGSLVKRGGGFKIDHPLAPAQKYLQHSFVESPERKNVYDGVIVLDQSGHAVVELPAWFEALNTDFRYQLTCLGRFAPVYISQKLSGNRFTIAGGHAGLEVSWQVTGIRSDSWAKANPLLVEEEKPALSQTGQNSA